MPALSTLSAFINCVKELKMKVENLTEKEIAYILHRYYPEHTLELTNLDWMVYLILTNYLCGHKILPSKNSPQYNRLEQMVSLYYS